MLATLIDQRLERRARLDRLSRQVIGEAIRVRSRLGWGFNEKVYENALALRLRKIEVAARQQEPVHVYFEDEIVGTYLPDLLVDDALIVEIKAVDVISVPFRVQVLNYLCATGLSLGLILNFGPKSLQIARLVHDH